MWNENEADMSSNTFAKMHITDAAGIPRSLTCFAATMDVLLASLDVDKPAVADVTPMAIEELFLDLPDMVYTRNETDIIMHINSNPV